MGVRGIKGPGTRGRWSGADSETTYAGETITSNSALRTYTSGRLLAPVIIDADDVTLEGSTADRDDTVLWANFEDSVGAAMFDAQGGYPGGGAVTTIANAVAATDTTITWTDGSGLPSGDAYLVVREYNDTAFFTDELDLPDGTGYNTAGNRGSGNTPYIRNTIVHQTSRTGNVSTLERAVGMIFGTGADTEVKVLTDPVKNLTIRNMTLVFYPGLTSGTPDAGDYSNAYPDYLVSLIKAMGAINITLDNVKLVSAGQQAVLFDGVYEPSVTDVLCDGGWNKGTGGNGYFEVSRTVYGTFNNVTVDNMRHLAVQWSSHSNSFDGVHGNSDVNLHGGACGGHIPVSNTDTAQNNTLHNVTMSPRASHVGGADAVNRTPDSATYAPPDFIRANRVFSDGGTTEIFRETFLPFASLDFELSSSMRLHMTNADWGAYDRAKWAFSVWFKRESITALQRFFGKGTGTTTAEFFLAFDASDRIDIRTYSAANTENGRLNTTATYTDTTNWHHLLFHFDRANATAGDRMRLWVDGAEVTSFATDTNPSADCYTSTQNVSLGAMNTGGNPFDGLLFQPAFFSGTLPAIGDLYDAGAPKDVTGLTGLYSLHQTNLITPLTTDFVKGASKWVNTNSTAAVITRPYT